MTEGENAVLLSLVGRMAMLETLNANLLAHFCIQFDQPVALAAHILDATETTLLNRQRTAAAPEERQIAEAALTSYAELSKAMLSMVNRIAVPEGRG